MFGGVFVVDVGASNVFEWMEQAQASFVGSSKASFGPKYKKGDVVSFNFYDGKPPLEGMVQIVDRYGTFEQSDEPSYDIYRFENNTLYKHVRESLVVAFVREGFLSEIEENIKKF